MVNKNRIAKLITFLLIIMSSLTWFFCVFNFFGAIEDEFNSLFQMLPFLITGILNLMLVYLGVHQAFIKRLDKKLVLIWMGVLLGLTIFNFVEIFTHFHYFFQNSVNTFKITFLLFWNIVYLIISITGIALTFLGKLDKEADPLFKGVFPRIEKKGRRVLYAVHYVFASYFFGDFILALFRGGNYMIEPAVYPFLLIFLLAPMVNIIWNMFFSKENRKASNQITFGVINGLCIIGYLIIGFCFEQHLVNVAQCLFFIDYATSYAIGPVLIFLMGLTEFLL